MAKIRVNISLDEEVLEEIDALAEEYTDGDRSAWIAHAATQDGDRMTPKQTAKLRKLRNSLRELAVFADGVAS